MHRLSWLTGRAEGKPGRLLEVRCQGKAWHAAFPAWADPVQALQDFQAWYQATYGEECHPARGRVYLDGKLSPPRKGLLQ